MVEAVVIERIQQVIIVVEMVAVAVFAITGALAAARREMDPIGFIMLGTATGVGGGTLRDLALGTRPVFWVSRPEYLWVCIIASLATFWAARLLNSRYRALLWIDAVGLGMYAVIGAQKAVAVGASGLVAVVMGVLTVVVGGLLRDILAGEKPLLFHREIYATAAIAGALAYLGLESTGVVSSVAAFGGFLVGFGVRAAAILFGLSMIHYVRPDRPLDGPEGRGNRNDTLS